MRLTEEQYAEMLEKSHCRPKRDPVDDAVEIIKRLDHFGNIKAKKRIIAGIDPGVKTGLAIWDARARSFTKIATCGIIEAMRLVRISDVNEVWFEDARQRGGEYNPKILQGVGSIRRESAIWQEFCEFYKIPYRALKPDESLTKWSVDYFEKVTGWTKRTSEHARDAACLVYGVR